MRHNPAAGAIVIMLRSLKMHGMAQAVGELTEQGSPAFEAALLILSQLLKAETADRRSDRRPQRAIALDFAYRVTTRRGPPFPSVIGSITPRLGLG